MDISKRIIALREEKGWSQRELAKRIEINVSVMNRIESGERAIKDHELAKISDVLDIASDYLLGRIDKFDNDKPKKDDQLEYYRNQIVTEFPDIDLMFKDMASLNSQDLKEIYEYIKFKMTQKEK